jgi:hypothetical protein
MAVNDLAWYFFKDIIKEAYLVKSGNRENAGT